MTDWQRLVMLALRERELLETGLWDDLLELQREREALVERLPEQLPAAARPALAEANRIVASSIAVLRHRCHDTAAELARLGQGRRALGSYAGSGESGLDLRG